MIYFSVGTLAIWPGLAIGRLAVWPWPKWPKKSWPRPNANTDLLYNDLVKLLKDESLGWYGRCYESIGSGFIKALTDLLWYIDPHHEKLKSQSCNIPKIFLSLSQYKIKSSYNLFYYAKKHKKDQLMQENLKDYLKVIENFVT